MSHRERAVSRRTSWRRPAGRICMGLADRLSAMSSLSNEVQDSDQLTFGCGLAIKSLVEGLDGKEAE